MGNEDDKSQLPASAKNAEVDAFLRKVAAMPAAHPVNKSGKLIFAMDATASRQPSWDQACKIQGEMFEATSALGGLDVQLVYYRGFNECKASKWLSTAPALQSAMSTVSCAGGETQIARVLRHALNAAEAQKIGALVFVGDVVEESVDTLCALAGQLGLHGVPVFVFQEGYDTDAERAFKEIARLSHGAYCRLDASSAAELRALLGAVAAYAVGGHRGLASYGKSTGGSALLLAKQMGSGS